MRPNDFDITLYDAGAPALINSVVNPLVALQDTDALAALTGYLTVYLAQASSLGLVANQEALQMFVLHAQRVQAIDVAFLDASFLASVRSSVPSSPPVAPENLWLSDAGGGVVNATSSLGQNADRHELQHYEGGDWVTVAQGVMGESTVDYQHTGVTPGSHQYRVLARIGFFAGFPGEAKTVIVA